MTLAKIKAQLKKECNAIIPDQRERIMLIVGEPSPEKKGKKTSVLKWFAPLVACACFCLILTLTLFLPNYGGGGSGVTVSMTSSMVVLEVNPVFELKSDNKENIISVRGLNKQAVMLLNGSEGSYNGKPLTEALDNITKLVVDGKYVKDKVSVSATCLNQTYENQLEQKAVNEVKNSLNKLNITASVVEKTKNVESEKFAKEYKVTEQKMSICLELIKNDSNLKLDKLVKEDIDDLIELLYDYDSGKMIKFTQDLQENNKAVAKKKDNILAKLDKTTKEINDLCDSIIENIKKIGETIAQKDIDDINKKITDLNLYYIEPIIEENITLETDLSDFSKEITDIKKELEENLKEVREEINSKYAEHVAEYEKKLKKGIDSDDDFDFDDFEDFEFDMEIKLPINAKN